MTTIYVDNNGSNDSTEYKNSVYPLKDLGRAIEVAQTGDTVNLSPGNFGSTSLTSHNEQLCYNILGSGLKTYVEDINISSNIDLKLRNLTLLNMDLNSKKSHLKSEQVVHLRSGSINLEGTSYLSFVNDTFNHNSNIIIKDGTHIIEFNQCTFKSSSIVVLVIGGKVTIKVVNCILNIPICNNQGGDVEIHHACSLFSSQVCIGNDCKVISRENPGNSTREDLYYRAVSVDSNRYHNIDLDKRTEFVVIYGDAPEVGIRLNSNCSNGHVVNIKTGLNVRVIITGNLDGGLKSMIQYGIYTLKLVCIKGIWHIF